MLENLDPVLLSRIQFAFTISFHIIFPALTIGLASWLVVVEAMYLKTKHPIYKEIYKFWVKIFAVAFGMGVVSGIVMSYQFGTNWSVFSDKVGNVMGPLMGYEVLTAFFLEASFLGIMLFGWDRVSRKAHFVATSIVAVGTLISAFWILSANSWMHTPAGYEIKDGIFYATNWFEVVFNPSFPYRFTHMIIAAYLATAFFVAAVGAWYLLKRRFVKHARIMLFSGMLMALFVAPMQLIVGDFHGLNTLEHQPAKVMAMEGIWEDEQGAGLRLFAIPDEENETNRYEVVIPKLTSLILTHSLDGELKGLKNWDESERPPVVPVFFFFRVMVGIGMAMIATGLVAGYLFYKKRMFRNKWFLRWCTLMAPSGFIAILSGWFVTEIGRQPYLVYGYLKTKDMVSPVAGDIVAISLFSLVAVYLLVFGSGFYFILKLIRKGPIIGEWTETYGQHGVDRPPTMGDIFPKRLEAPPKHE